MTGRDLQLQGFLYPLDEELWQAHLHSKSITRQLNATLETEMAKRKALVQELFAGAGENAYVEPPFYCDYGRNTWVGKNFYCNYDCVFLECGPIKIGDNVMFGPKVALYAVNHPTEPEVRATNYNYPEPITIGNDVWIGGSVVVCPGVTIGDNTVIGAGSVVTKDIPSGVVAAGNPCRVIRDISQEECDYWKAQFAMVQKMLQTP